MKSVNWAVLLPELIRLLLIILAAGSVGSGGGFYLADMHTQTVEQEKQQEFLGRDQLLAALGLRVQRAEEELFLVRSRLERLERQIERRAKAQSSMKVVDWSDDGVYVQQRRIP